VTTIFVAVSRGVGTGWAGWAVARPSIYNRGMATVIFGPPSIWCGWSVETTQCTRTTSKIMCLISYQCL